MFPGLEHALASYIYVVPLELFVFVASILEEIIAPIPSPTVMMLTGYFAQVQGASLYALIPLVVIGTIGKTIGATVVYMLADTAEDIVVGKFGKFFNIEKDDIEKFGKKLQGGFRDYVILSVLRAMPFVPSTVISVGSGVLKIPKTVYVVSTAIGTLFRDSFYIYAGYVGLELLRSIIETASIYETYIEICVAVLVVSFVLYKKFKV
jgi:membrane protein DedA with SNARE-associated domain